MYFGLKIIFNLSLLGLILTLYSCMPEEKTAKCAVGQTYDATTRRCIASFDYASNRQPLIAANQAVALTEDDAFVNFSVTTAVDADADVLQYLIITDPANGSITNCMGELGSLSSSDLTCTYTPNANFAGTDSFVYKVFDGKEYSIQNATVTFTVAAAIDAPTITAIADQTVNEYNSNDAAYDGYLQIAGIVIDEGGGTDENSEQLTIQVDSSNQALVANSDINIYYNGSLIGLASGGVPIAIGDGSGSAGASTVMLRIFSQEFANNVTEGGNTTITVTVTSDSGAPNSVVETFVIDVTAINNKPEHSTSGGIVTTAGTTTVDEDAGVTAAATYQIDEGGGGTADDEDAQTMTVKAVSSNQTLIPDANIDLQWDDGGFASIGAGGAYRGPLTEVAGAGDLSAHGSALRVDYTPVANQSGTATITVYFLDSDGAESTKTIPITVNSINDAPTVTAIANININEDLGVGAADSNLVTFTVEEDANTLEDADSMSVKVTSSCQETVSDSNIAIAYNGSSIGVGGDWRSIGDSTANVGLANITLTITPNGNANENTPTGCGATPVTTTITVEVSDGTVADNISTTFDIDLDAVDDNPTITSIPDQIVNEGTVLEVDTDAGTTGVQGITVDEGGADDEDSQGITVKVASSDTSLIPQNAANIGITYGGTVVSTSGGGGGAALEFALGDAAASADGSEVGLSLKPIVGVSGSVDITVTVDDGTNTASTVFQVTVTDASATHGGWSDVIAKGPVYEYLNGQVATLVSGKDLVVSFSWNAMTAYNTTLSGYHVFRSDDGESGTFTQLTSTVLSSATTSYTDTSLTNSDVGKIFWYQVKPVASNGMIMDTNVNYSKLRIIVPPKNMVLVHRRIANKEICGTIGATSDKSNHNRCTYYGPGNTVIAGSHYYDLGKDLIVDRYEAGCPYTFDTSNECTETGQGCIGRYSTANSCDFTAAACGGNDCTDIATGNNGSPDGVVNGTAIGDYYYDSTNSLCYYNTDAGNSWSLLPIGNVTASQGSIYYSRDSGKCFIQTSAVLATSPQGWADIQSATDPPDLYDDNYSVSATFSEIDPSHAHLPPLVYISQERAHDFCDLYSGTLTQGAATSKNYDKRLPTRKEQIAMSAWSTSVSSIGTMEAGASLSSSTSQCNSSSGGSLAFDDSTKPASAIIDSLPGTYASGIRSVRTGSNATASCVSRYGLQDHVGNVKEWTSFQIQCAVGDDECTSVSSEYSGADAIAGFPTDTDYVITTGSQYYDFDDTRNASGPYDVGSALTSWLMSAGSFNTSTFYMPMGLPGVATAVGTPPALSSFTLNSDYIYINAAAITTNGTDSCIAAPAGEKCGGAVTGGDYNNSASAAGRYTIEFKPLNVVEDSGYDKYTGFRCVSGVSY